MSANDTQVGGSHYQKPIQVWDFIAANELDYFQGNIIKYVTRFREKGGVADLEKAKHYLEKLIEMEMPEKSHNSDEEAWKVWNGVGVSPVPKDKIITVQLRNGCCLTGPSKYVEWDHAGKDSDIVAYRVLP